MQTFVLYYCSPPSSCSYSTLQEAITGIWNDITYYGYSTKTDVGLDKCADRCFGSSGDRAGNQNLAILATDGKSHNDVTLAAAKLRSVAKVVAVGIDSADETQLSNIVGGDSSCWFKVKYFSDLKSEVSRLMKASCGEQLSASYLSVVIIGWHLYQHA